jgi:peptide/nickel transport system substrate-binding protein
MSSDSRFDDLVQGIRGSQINRRSMLRLMGVSSLGLLAACSSKSSTGSDETPASTSASSGGTTATSPSTGSGGATPGSTGSPVAEGTSSAAPTPAGPAPKKGGTLVIGLDQEPPTMDPHASPSAITFYITASTAESLLYLNAKREIVPHLAASYEAAPDAKSFTFKLNSDITFQDDTPFNADAVKYNFDRIVAPNFKAGSALGSLTGYSGTAVVDPQTVTVSFKDAFVPFLTYSAGGTLAMVSPTGTPKQGEAVNQTPITTGPFKLTDYVAKDHCTMERWDGYKRTSPWASEAGPGYLDKVTWKFVPEAGTRTTTVESGETQMVVVVVGQDLAPLKANKDLKVAQQPWTGTPRIWLLNVTLAPTDDVKVRQAINYAIDKSAIVNTIYRGLGNPGHAPMTKVMLDDPSLDSYYGFDADKAKQLLTDAGWTGDSGIRQKDGKPLKLVLNAIDYGGGPEQTVILIQGQLHDVGIDVEIKAQARPPWYEDNYKGATNGPVMFLRSGDLDGLYALFHSSNIGGNFNWSMLNDPDVDKMLLQGREESDPDKRKDIYLKLEQKLLDEAVSVNLVDELSTFVMRSNVYGLQFNGYTYPVVAGCYMA